MFIRFFGETKWEDERPHERPQDPTARPKENPLTPLVKTGENYSSSQNAWTNSGLWMSLSAAERGMR